MKNQLIYPLIDLFKYSAVVCRFVGLMLFIPGFGDPYIPQKIKVLTALMLGIAITPLLDQYLASLPSSPLNLFLMLLGELFIGYALATIVRFIISAFDVAGTLIGYQIGFANVFIASSASAQQSAITASFLGLMAVMILFATDLHFIFLGTLVDSYNVWKPGALPNILFFSEDFFALSLDVLSKSLWLCLQLSGPIIIVSVLLNIAGGVLNKLIPQIQVFFVLQPLQIAVGFIVIYLTLEVSLRLMYGDMEEIFTSLWAGGRS